MSLKPYRRPGTKTWYVRGTVRGRRVYEAAGTEDRALCEALCAKRETELFAESILGKRLTVSFQRAALSYLEFEARSDRTESDVERLVAHFGARMLPVDQDAADAAVATLVGRDAAPATKRRAVYAPLTAILNHAHARGWCDKPAFQQPALPKGKTRWLTPAEALALIAAAAPHLKPLLLFVLCTGARMSEALDLDWADVDLPAAKAVFRDTKNGTDRAAALPEAAVIALANLPPNAVAARIDAQGTREDSLLVGRQTTGRNPEHRSLAAGWDAPQRTGRVFRTDDGSPYHDAERQYGGQIKTAWRSALRRAQIRVPTSPHDLRHTWATWFYGVTKDLLLLKQEGGWQSAAMVERYAHLMPSALVGEIRSVWGASHPRIGALPGAQKITEARTA